MPTKREREYYAMGFRDGERLHRLGVAGSSERRMRESGIDFMLEGATSPRRSTAPKRKLSAWNKYVKNKRNHITYRDGKLNLKKMAVAFRRKKRR
jgi:hypothetical protein